MLNICNFMISMMYELLQHNLIFTGIFELNISNFFFFTVSHSPAVPFSMSGKIYTPIISERKKILNLYLHVGKIDACLTREITFQNPE